LTRGGPSFPKVIDPNRKIRWGVLGWARIARDSVMPAIQRSGNSELRSLGSRDPAKLAECNKRFPGVRTLPGYEEVLRDPEVDAVYIPLPNSLHREWTLRAAERGKHVLCEKPIGLNASECREMTAACARNGVTLMEAFMYRYTDRTRQVTEVLRSGVLGEIKFVEASFRFFLADPGSIKFKPELGGGSLYDVGCYPVNFSGLVADTIAGTTGMVRPVSVAAECVRVGGVDRIFSAVMRYPSGLIAAVHSGFDGEKRVFAEVVGTRGILHVADTFFDNAGALVLTIGEKRREIPVAESDRYRREIEDFADAALHGRPPKLGMAETLRNMEVIDRLYEASRGRG
jgi:D-xylose 1-dehydrogenase (NADP+, D-xylono-1,5-lactone-forming)